MALVWLVIDSKLRQPSIQISSWPTTQAETSNPLRHVARVETLPLKGPRLLIRH
jgi:hypothetical protein